MYIFFSMVAGSWMKWGSVTYLYSEVKKKKVILSSALHWEKNRYSFKNRVYKNGTTNICPFKITQTGLWYWSTYARATAGTVTLPQKRRKEDRMYSQSGGTTNLALNASFFQKYIMPEVLCIHFFCCWW